MAIYIKYLWEAPTYAVVAPIPAWLIRRNMSDMLKILFLFTLWKGGCLGDSNICWMSGVSNTNWINVKYAGKISIILNFLLLEKLFKIKAFAWDFQ